MSVCVCLSVCLSECIPHHFTRLIIPTSFPFVCPSVQQTVSHCMKHSMRNNDYLLSNYSTLRHVCLPSFKTDTTKPPHTLIQEFTISYDLQPDSPALRIAHLSQRLLVHTLAKHSFAHAHHTSRLVLHMRPKTAQSHL